MNTIRTVVLLTVLTLGLVFIGGMIGGQSGALFAPEHGLLLVFRQDRHQDV
jgi:hypothetical protein